MFAIFEYGRVVMMQQMMENAARAGARTAVVTPTSYTDAAPGDQQRHRPVINNQLAGLPLSNVTIHDLSGRQQRQQHRRLDQHAVRPEHRRPDRRRLSQPVSRPGCPPESPRRASASVIVNFLPNSSTAMPNAIHLTAKSHDAQRGQLTP